MYKILIISLVLCSIILSSCSKELEKNNLSSDQVIEKLEHHGINLKKEQRNPNPLYIFHREIDGVEPKIYLNDELQIIIYVFSNNKEMKIGREVFYDTPAEIVEHLTYELNNILLFCIVNRDEIKEKINNAVSQLKEVI